jgi:uncharacterized protein YecE (DUF72 family)
VYDKPGIDKLAYVSRFVDCIEINSTFYRPPVADYVESWLAKTLHKPDFFFTAKLHCDFTHQGRLDTDMVTAFHEGFAPLLAAGKLRQVLAQFRYDYDDTPAHRAHMTEIVKRFSDTFGMAVEVRHRSWQAPEALGFLEALGVTVCNLDYPTTCNSFDLALCTIGRQGYLRLHGRNAVNWFSKVGRDETYDYYYNEEELAGIRVRIEDLARALGVLTVITNNHYRGAELANALELKALITGRLLEVPEGLLRTYPDLERIAANKPLFGNK